MKIDVSAEINVSRYIFQADVIYVICKKKVTEK